MWGTRAPTAKNFVATAIPIWPVALSLAMIDQVMELAPRGVALHAARVGRGTAARADLGRGGQAAFRPVRPDFDNVSALSQIFEIRAVRRPSDQSGLISTMCPRFRKFSIVALGTRFSITSTPGREVRGQNEVGKCSECQAGASIASCKFSLAWTWRRKNCVIH